MLPLGTAVGKFLGTLIMITLIQGCRWVKFLGGQHEFADKEEMSDKESFLAFQRRPAQIVYCKFVNKLNIYWKFAEKPNVLGVWHPLPTHPDDYAPASTVFLM